MSARDLAVAEAYRWLSTPYAHGQRVRGAGVDCVQFLIACYVAAGAIQDFTPSPYPPDWHLHHDSERLLVHLLPHCVPTRDPVPGDLVTYRFGRAVSHAAMLVAPGEIIHAYAGHSVFLDRVDFAGAERFAGAYTLRAWSIEVAA